MDWPSIEDYRTAFQRPEQVFRDAKLQSCVPERNKMGLPRGRAGGYAIVYRMSNASWSTAVRVFLNRPKPDRQKRYQMVHSYLEQTRPRCLVNFGYDPEGILIAGQRFPIQTLEWVEGMQLGEWVKDAMSRRDSRAIKQMADAWIELVGELRSHKIAHGDLQHGNVLVVGSRLVLVDYDCMYVPTMRSDVDREAWEFGMPGYQHPDRVGRLLGPEFDNFSAWAILIALRAVADDPDLWRQYVGDPEVENLLFTRDDIEHPAQSQLWRDLIQNAKDRKVKEWAAQLRASLDGPFEQVPPFELDIFDPLRAVIAGADWQQIHELATSKKYAAKTLPGDLALIVQEAARRVECLSQLEAKVRSGRVQDIALAYKPALLDGWADPALLSKARAAAGAIELIGELHRADQADPGGRLLVSLWQDRGGELSGLVEGTELSGKVAACQARIAAAERLCRAVLGNGTEHEIAAAWQAVDDGGGHPDAEPHRGRAELAVRRFDALKKLRGCSQNASLAGDRALTKLWDDLGAILDGCAEAEAFRKGVAAARERTAKLDELLGELDGAEQADPSGRLLVSLWQRRGGELAGLTEGNELREKVAAWQTRIAAAERLKGAVLGNGTEEEIAESWQAVVDSGGHHDAEPYRVRAGVAVKRFDALRKLSRLPRKEDEAADRALVRVWDAVAHVLDGCTEADAYRDRTAAARNRSARLNELNQLIATADVGRCSERDVVAAAAQLPSGYSPRVFDRVQKARNRIAAAKALTKALRTSPQSDLEIAAAAERARQEGTWPSKPTVSARCDLAFRRRAVIRVLDAIPASIPLDAQDAKWVAAWDQLLSDSHDASDHRARYELAVARIAAAAELAAAIAAHDVVKVKQFRHDQRLSRHPILVRRKIEIDELIATSERVERLVSVARLGNGAAFLAQAEPALLAAHPDVFLPFRADIESWIDSQLREGNVLNHAEPEFLNSGSTGSLVARWIWGQQRLVRTCLVAADPSRFFDRIEDAKGVIQKIDPDAHRRAQGGAAVLAPPGCTEFYVTVWPVVDFGWTRRTGPPFHVGPHVDGSPQSTDTSNGRSPAGASVRERLENWLVRKINDL
jgi:hypothetical protein